MPKLRISLIMLLLSLALYGTAMVSGVEAQVGGCSTTHIVQRGENLYRIASQYRTTIADIQARNSISNPDRIFAGQRLCIAGGFVPQPNPNPGNYTPAGSARVTTHTLNIRTGPGLQYSVIAQARYGNTLPVLGRTWDSNWYQIAYGVGGAGRAWIFARLTYTANPQNLPVISSPTTPAPYSAQVPLASNATTYSGPTTLTAIPPHELFTGTTVLVIGRTAAADWFQVQLGSGLVWLRHDAFPNAMARFEFPVTA